MIEELRSVRLAYRFTHELVRRALYDALTAARRAELHLRVGEALERVGGAPAADLAHHFTVAAPLAGAARGVAYNVAAARAAAAALAYDEADERLSVALSLGVEDPARARAAADRARHDPQPRRPGGRRAAGLRRGRDARARRRSCWPRPRSATRRPAGARRSRTRWRSSCSRARPRSSTEQPSRLRVGVLGGLARALQMGGEQERGAAVRDEAVAMARVLGDRAALCSVLAGSYWSRGTSSPEQVLELLTEARDLATELGDVDLQTEAMLWRVPALLVVVRPRDRARGGGRGARDRGAHRAAVQPARRRALRVGDRALRGPARGRRGAGAALARVEPAADRP